MPRVSLLQTNFTAGELSPRLVGRVDIDRYGNGARTLLNGTVAIQGGVRRRDGLRYIAAAKVANRRARLIPYVFSRTQAYVLEFGHLYMRVYRDGAQVAGPYEIATPYTEAMLPLIDYAQRADSMFLAHPDVAMHRLQRFADNQWVLAPVPWVTEPFDEIGHRFAGVNLSLSGASVGTGRTVSASAGVFLAGDVGRTITWQGGLATITAFTASNAVTITIVVAFPSASVPAGWVLNGTPQTTVTASAATPVGGGVTLTATTDTFRASDVGRHVQINGGLVQITGFTSAQNVAGTIKQALSSAVAAPANAWVLNGPVWTADLGYPRTVTFHQQRLIAAGSAAFPETVWGSRTGEPLNFESGTRDDDAFAFTVAGEQVSPIQYVASGRALTALTYGGEAVLLGGVEKPITPTNVQVTMRSNHGAASVRPVTVRNELVFAQRAARKLRAFAYQAQADDFSAPDLTVLSEHITSSGVVELAFQQEPDSLLLAARADGALAVATFDRDQQVIAWQRWVTDGFIESVATVPTATADATYAIVRRTVSGAPVRYVEIFESRAYTYPTGERVDVSLDSYIVGTNGGGSMTWTGIGHLEGRAVECVADGAYMGTFTVSGGQITIPRAALEVVIGLPYQMRVELLPPELQTGTGTAQGNQMSVHEVVLRLVNSVGGTINGTQIPTRRLGPGVLDRPPVITTGLVRVPNLGWALGEAPVVIEQQLPLSFQMLNVVRKVTVNDG